MMTFRQLRNALKGKPLKAALLLGLFAFVMVMAHSWAWHHAVCAEAGTPGHQCAATMLASGQVDAAPNVVAVTIASVVAVAVVLPDAPNFAVADHSLPSSRAPPAFLT